MQTNKLARRSGQRPEAHPTPSAVGGEGTALRHPVLGPSNCAHTQYDMDHTGLLALTVSIRNAVVLLPSSAPRRSTNRRLWRVRGAAAVVAGNT